MFMCFNWLNDFTVITPASIPPNLSSTGECGLNQKPKSPCRICKEMVMEIQLKAFSSEEEHLLCSIMMFDYSMTFQISF